jgi:predicted phosphoribosyltransferase
VSHREKTDPLTWERIKSEADEAVCRIMPRNVRGAGGFYEGFPQMTCGDVRALLNTAGGE